MSSSDPLVGSVLDDRYEILRRLARGGMATVYIAHDKRLTRTVAVKVMHEGLGDDHDFAAKFDREARSAATLVHPNVVSVFDQGRDHGRPYIVMELVEGCTLRQLICKEAPMAPQRALDLIEPVVSALAAAHEAGIVHRDIKPENVLISDRGHVKVADFGLAKAVTAQTATAAQGLVIGTVSYLAPELVTDGSADTRTDVYAVGILLFEMLTGKKPHTGETPIQVAYSHVNNAIGAPSAALDRKAAFNIPAYIDALVMTAAARQPDDRPRDAKVLLHHIQVARSALAAGSPDDPGLSAQMRMTTIPAGSEFLPAITKAPDAATALAAPTRLVASPPVSAISSDSVSNLADQLEPSPAGGVALAQKTVKRRKRSPLMVALTMVLALLLGSGVWYLAVGRYEAAPDLVGKSQDEAVAAAQAAGFNPVMTEGFSEDIAVGFVAATNPAPGRRILHNGTITLIVSRGPERYPVPNVIGMDPVSAQATLTENHLGVGLVTEVYHDTIPAGQVSGVSVPVDTPVKPETAIDLELSKGPAPVTLISFVGKSVSTARTGLQELGLKVAINQVWSDAVAEGIVISQSPDTGEAHRTDTVTLVVSKGPQLVTVPDIAYQSSKDEAVRKLTDAGLQVEINAPYGGSSQVVSVSPASGSQVKVGSKVTLTVV